MAISLLTTAEHPSPIEVCLTAWHGFLTGDRDTLDRVLADDVVLHSPVLFAPVVGKELVAMYLTGASMTFVGPSESTGDRRDPTGDDGEWDGRFRYVRKLVAEHDAVLEFETTMRGKYVNGVDLITCDDDGRIVDFKVMVRPRQAVEAVRELMAAALEQLGDRS